MMLALKLSDPRAAGRPPRLRTIADTVRATNSQDLLQMLDKEGVLLRYPKTTGDALLHRCYTYVPGAEAYPENMVKILLYL